MRSPEERAREVAGECEPLAESGRTCEEVARETGVADFRCNPCRFMDRIAAAIAAAFAEQRERDAQRIDYLYDRSLEEQQTFEREGLTAEAERAKMKGIAFHQARESVRHGSDGGD